MSDFNAEELSEAIDRCAWELLARYNIDEPPVDALQLVQDAFRYTVTFEEAEDDEPQYGDRPKRRRPRELIIKEGQSPGGQQMMAARACARELVPAILAKLGVVPGTEQKSATTQLSALVAPRLLLPTRWFGSVARKANNDLVRIQETFDTAGLEVIALRLLDLDDHCVIAIVDDGAVGLRRSNAMQATKKLTAAEEYCIEQVIEHEEPRTVRKDGWTSRGWPVPTGPFNRILLRSEPDDV